MGRPVVMKSWYCEAQRAQRTSQSALKGFHFHHGSHVLFLAAGIYYGAAGCLHPFLSVYYRRIGLNERQIGVLGALKPWASGLTAPLWAFAADRMGKHRLVVAMCMTAAFLVSGSRQWNRKLAPYHALAHHAIFALYRHAWPSCWGGRFRHTQGWGTWESWWC